MKITILHHKYTDPEKTPALINHLAGYWLELGHQVVHVKGVDNPLPEADVLILHVNLTIVPPEYIRAVEQFPVVINRNVIDISKSAFSQIMVNQDDPYPGPVIVKTRNNYGGIPERRANLKNGAIPGNLISGFCRRFDSLRTWRNVRYLKEYQVFESIQEVPDGVWQNEHLLVEKFLPERDRDGNYHVREWVFLGDREIHFMNISREPVIRGINAYQREYLTADEIPDILRKTRKSLGLDYGKFDYVINNESPVIFDINKTIGVASNMSKRDRAHEHIRELSQGLKYYLYERIV